MTRQPQAHGRIGAAAERADLSDDFDFSRHHHTTQCWWNHYQARWICNGAGRKEPGAVQATTSGGWPPIRST